MNIGEYKEIFLTEAKEYLSTLNNALVLLERDPSQAEPIREIFRAAHTLKGMSATMGYDPMARLTHQMETVLDPIRSGASPLTPSLVDALFVCLDQLEKWVESLSQRDFLEEEGLARTLQMLQAVGSGSAASPSAAAAEPPEGSVAFRFSDSEREVLAQAGRGGFSLFRVMVELDAECVFKEVRAFMVLQAVHELGEVVKSHPEPGEIEKGRFSRRFYLVVVTDRPPEKWREALAAVSEVSRVQVDPFTPESAAAPPPAEAGARPAASKSSSPALVPEEKAFALPTIRVHTSKLDKLMALVQELVISKIRFEQVASTRELKELDDPLSQLTHITDELQDEIMKVRLMPVKQIFERFPRMVRDLAKALDKRVDLEMEGAEVELDRTVLEEMSEPLVHLLRNAVDHGIEPPDERVREGKEAYGTIRLQARRERSYVVISVADDGRGVDPEVVRRKSVDKGLVSSEEAGKLTDEEAVRLITLPGFSTRDSATEVSGRGVGVDVAKTRVEGLGGTFRIQSRKGHGTTFLLRFPLTLAIIKALLVEACGEVFAIPVVNVVETVEVPPSEKKRIQQQETIVLREEVIPVYPLGEMLELEAPPPPPVPPELESVLIVEVGDSRVGISVERIIGQQEIAIKSLDRLLKGIRGFSGATILGNGKIALILDIASLVDDLKDRRFQAEHPLLDKDDAHALEPR